MRMFLYYWFKFKPKPKMTSMLRLHVGGTVQDWVQSSKISSSIRILCDPRDCSLPGFSVHGISQARILEWVDISFSKGASRPRDQTHISCIGRWIPSANARDMRDIGRFHPCVRKISWWRKCQPTLVFLPGKSHGQRSLVGYSQWYHKELDTTGHTHNNILFVFLIIVMLKFKRFIDIFFVRFEE